MSLKGLVSLLNRYPDSLWPPDEGHTPEAPFQVTARQGARPAYVAALWARRSVPLLVITPRPEDSRRLHDQLLTYLGDTAPLYLLPEPEVLPFERLAVDAHTSNQRLSALAALGCSGEAANRTAPLVVTSVAAALRKTLPPAIVAGTSGAGPDGGTRQLRVGQRLPRLEDILSRWVELGYRHEPVVESPGFFSHRGGIIDVYPAQADMPFRIELWDDEIETIRQFDPYTQRSVGGAEQVTIIPAREQLPDLVDRGRVEQVIAAMDFTNCHQDLRERMEEDLVDLFSDPNMEALHFYNGLLNQANLLDYLPSDAALVLDRMEQIEAEAQDQEEKFDRIRASREGRGELPRNFPSPYVTWHELSPIIRDWRAPRAFLQGWLTDDQDPIFSAATPYFSRLEQFTADVQTDLGEGKSVVVVSQHHRRLAEILEEADVAVTTSEDLDDPPQAGRVYLVPGSLREGWTTEADAESPAVILLTDAELFGAVKERRYRRQRPATVERGREVVLSQLEPGNYVVHVDHGVARFAGVTHMGEDEDKKEYLVLEYADNDKLYVPTEHLDRVGAYVGAQDQPPSLTRLGTAEWSRIKERVKGATKELAEELIRLYAARQAAQGHEFGPDTVWQREVEDSFPYEETPDQVQAIEDVKADMEQRKPMDRLICGDVGYGKTEVALRAAFKTVSEGMQVGILVPTTVLAQQHYATFSDRLAPFPLQVEVLSRFRTAAEQQEVVSGLKQGSVDIVIGTHRLLQKDVQFKNLGLVVVDEEQRFGVSHKERLKRLRNEVDVLTLSATPIPRTLHMALSGIRDMSIMHTPPEARLPVKTFVSEYSDEIIKEAVLREMDRGGQVFLLHNRVRTIQQTAAELSELVPQARIMIGHGQMPETELEDVMVGFSAGEADVLVCTTIIESGLDMPNVNTLIIDRADRFGLSQLYQLRGRVGRGDHRAYAYLLLPRGRRITGAAEKRIEAILEASDLGSGFRIAMRDMEIRGAGNLLGAAQSGNMHAVGMDLYGQLLQEAVAELFLAQGKESADPGSAPTELPRVELPLNASIPEAYLPHMATRLSIYQRLARIQSPEEAKELGEELRDRFGPPPPEVEDLLALVDLRLLAGSLGVESVTNSGNSVLLVFREPVGSFRVPLQRALGPSVDVGNKQMRLSLRGAGDQWLPQITRAMQRLQVFQQRLQSLAAG